MNLEQRLGELERNCIKHLIEDTSFGTRVKAGDKVYLFDKDGRHKDSIIELLTGITRTVKGFIAEDKMDDLYIYLIRLNVDYDTDIQVLKTLLVVLKPVKEHVQMAILFYSLQDYFKEAERNLESIAAGNGPIKRPTDLENIKRIFTNNGSKFTEQTGPSGTRIIVRDACFTYDANGKEIDIDF